MEIAGSPAGIMVEYEQLKPTIEAHHRYRVGPGWCSSLLAQRVRATGSAVWAVLSRFYRPQEYKHFVRCCSIPGRAHEIRVGCLREVSVISFLSASTSTESLDILDDEHRVFGFSIIGGEYRLRNYLSVTTVTEFLGEAGEIWSVVLESYAVDVPDGNTEEDTRLLTDTVMRLNLRLKLPPPPISSPLQCCMDPNEIAQRLLLDGYDVSDILSHSSTTLMDL